MGRGGRGHEPPALRRGRRRHAPGHLGPGEGVRVRSTVSTAGHRARRATERGFRSHRRQPGAVLREAAVGGFGVALQNGPRGRVRSGEAGPEALALPLRAAARVRPAGRGASRPGVQHG